MGAAGGGARRARAAHGRNGAIRLGRGEQKNLAPPFPSLPSQPSPEGGSGPGGVCGETQPVPPIAARPTAGLPGGLPGETSELPPRPPLRDPVLVPTALSHLFFSTYVIVLVLFGFTPRTHTPFFSLLFPGAAVGCGNVWDTLVLQVDSWAGGSALLGWEGCLLLLFQHCAFLEFYFCCCSSLGRLKRWRSVF